MLLVAAVALSACGGGTTKVSPQTFVKDMCSALHTWGNALNRRVSQMTSAVQSNPSPAKGKQEMAKLIDGAVQDTDTLITSVKDAGAPDVSGGEDFVNRLTSSLGRAKSNLQSVRSEVDKLSTNSPTAFAAALGGVTKDLQNSFNIVNSSLGNIKAPGLDRAFNAEPSCSTIK